MSRYCSPAHDWQHQLQLHYQCSLAMLQSLGMAAVLLLLLQRHQHVAWKERSCLCGQQLAFLVDTQVGRVGRLGGGVIGEYSGRLALNLCPVPVGWEGQHSISSPSGDCPDLGQLGQVSHDLEERIGSRKLLCALHHGIKLFSVDCEPVCQDARHLDRVPVKSSHLQMHSSAWHELVLTVQQ